MAVSAPTRDTLDEVPRLCDAHGVVLIFDEVIVGFWAGLGGAQLLYGVTPDLTTLGKALGGGALPVSAVAGRRDIMALYETRTVVQERAPALHGVEALFFVLLHSPD